MMQFLMIVMSRRDDGACVVCDKMKKIEEIVSLSLVMLCAPRVAFMRHEKDYDVYRSI